MYKEFTKRDFLGKKKLVGVYCIFHHIPPGYKYLQDCQMAIVFICLLTNLYWLVTLFSPEPIIRPPCVVYQYLSFFIT